MNKLIKFGEVIINVEQIFSIERWKHIHPLSGNELKDDGVIITLINGKEFRIKKINIDEAMEKIGDSK